MEENRDYCGTTFGVIFTLIFVVTLPTTFLILNSYDIWELKLTIIPKLFGGTSQSHHQYHHKNDHQIISPNNGWDFASEISPNLSSCHDSYGRPGLLVNCCPPADGEARAVPVDFRLPSDPSIRVRRPVNRVGPEYWAKYARAVAIMKSLPHSDPRSFSRQAGIHCTFCTGAFDMKNSTWGLNVHRQWLFYPFHRMYLYFHERILGSLIGDPNFALPYWPWDHPDTMRFPDVFLSGPFFDTERDPTHFSPRIVDLAYNARAGVAGENLSVGPADNLAFMYNQMVSAASLPELFMGCALRPHEPDGFCDGPGTVEVAPHNTMHSWVGSAANPGREDMGIFYSAAWDPSFYPHHANVDRLFDVWRGIHGKHVPFEDPTWLNSYFYFYDENVNLVKIKVSDVLNATTLGYSYEDIELLWLNTRPKPSMSPKLAKLKLRKRLGSQITPQGLQTLGSPIRAKVSRPERERFELEEEVLVVHGIGVEESVDETVKFDVYVNLADETKLGASYREFVGTFTRLPEGHKRSSLASNNGVLKLGISEALRDLEADRDESVWVTLLPMTSSCAKVSIRGIRIEYMK